MVKELVQRLTLTSVKLLVRCRMVRLLLLVTKMVMVTRKFDALV